MDNWKPLERASIINRSDITKEGLDAVAGEQPEIWKNDIYTVLVRRRWGNPPIHHTWLSIKRNDKEPCEDWRHFQWIKNQLVGPECEGVQLYPKESRLVDSSNQFHLWVIEDSAATLPFGFQQRLISEYPIENGKQRPWPENMKPHDLEEQEAKLKGMMDNFNKSTGSSIKTQK